MVPKLVIICLDGATWNIIKPFADEGHLPYFKMLMDEGVWGTLKSTIPPVTAPAFTSFFTGKNPGKHGIFDFVRLENGKLKLIGPKDIKSATIFEILSTEKIIIISIGFPLSFPPKKGFNGIMISDFLHSKKEIFPESKSEYLKEYRVFPDMSKKGDELIRNMEITVRRKIQTAKKLFSTEKWDLFLFHIFSIMDGICHAFWSDINKNTKLGKRAKDTIKIADRFIGWVTNRMDENTILFLISDHGFADFPKRINLNKLFLEKGLIKITNEKIQYSGDNPFAKHLADIGGRKVFTIPKFLYILGSHPILKPLTRKIFQAFFGAAGVKYKDKVIDFFNSKAFVLTTESMGVYLNKMNENERRAIIRMLQKLRYRGNNVFKHVLLRNEVYSGPFLDSAPDILLIPNGFLITPLFTRLFEENIGGGFHDINGIFSAYGECINKGLKLDAKIYDIAPTILHIFCLPIPKDMDGKVLIEIFKKNSEFVKRTPVYIDPFYYKRKDEKERIRDKIEKLKQKESVS